MVRAGCVLTHGVHGADPPLLASQQGRGHYSGKDAPGEVILGDKVALGQRTEVPHCGQGFP